MADDPTVNRRQQDESQAAAEPSFVRPRKRRRLADADMDITPMIDVTFLLLIFFIVASHLDPQKAVDLPEAKYGIAVAEKTSVVLIVARGEPDVRIYAGPSKDPQYLVSGNLADQDAQIEQYVTRQLQEDPTRNHVLVMAERGINYRNVDRVIKAAGRALDGQSLFVATMEEQ